ncbi:hypothetical protein EST38_g6682 [Candolleomyces aberdarensis]|uniref:Uncharacterized protein n=1 Tax=Candolleomyces aberdarensis TaxID=2316362 RepID=A0A4Q2DKD1_9AGAR|nr:hypothetical protein EST38_g6682 [Candolleomyces aberdarensis]
MGSPNLEQDANVGVFSNEYDLAHEDPRILLEVQRALKLKARREARLKREQSASPQHGIGSSISPELAHASWRSRLPAVSSPPASPTPPRTASISTASDIDFSPAKGGSSSTDYSHPVPTSLDNGKTLDWGSPYTDDDKSDKRWPLIGKRKERDKILPLNALAEQQETIYREKLEKMTTVMSVQTQRKAAITREQLGRRYKLFSEHSPAVKRTASSFNLLNVARWYAGVDTRVKQAIEKAEPFSWLKHLERNHTKDRSEWHLSALVMEEFFQAQLCSTATMPTIPETAYPLPDSRTPSSPTSPPHTPLPSPDAVSFEPRRDSVDSSGTPNLPLSGASTSKNQIKPGNFAREYHPVYIKGDVSSVAESMSDFSDRGVARESPFIESARRSEHPSPKIQVIVAREPEDKTDQRTAIPVRVKLSTSSKGSAGEASSVKDQPAPQLLSHNSFKSQLPRRIRASHPSSDVLNKRFPEDNEVHLHREHESKVRILEEAHAHNHRTRQMLNRISAAVREYDAIQNAALKTPGIPHLPLPKELVEAFSHDPAAVTGATRRLRGWRAVEDIHQRVLRQRQTFKSFLSTRPTQASDPVQILDAPISTLMETLDVLETQKDEIVSTAANLAELLHEVQEVHRNVKRDYNTTVSRTSVVYPELSHIVALEESYRDQYQQLWDFAMDALTLLLDTVTPFWRNYGKTIGEDVRDFLIIPLYRNEFTGEPKRYPLTEIPRRSFSHWLGLVLFFFLSIALTFLQFRAAITSLGSYRLQWIPYDGVRWTALPFFWIGILILWIAVLFEFSVVIMQLGIITWWTGWLINVFQ